MKMHFSIDFGSTVKVQKFMTYCNYSAYIYSTTLITIQVHNEVHNIQFDLESVGSKHNG